MVDSRFLAHAGAMMAFVFFGSTALIVKPSSLAPLQLVFYRMAVTAAGTFVLAVLSGQFRRVSRRTVLFLCLTSASIFLNMICLFESFHLAPISVCVSIFFTGPIFTLLIRRLRSRLRFERNDRIAMAFALIACLLLALQSQSVDAQHIKGYLFALVGGILFGILPIFEENCLEAPPAFALFLQASFAVVFLFPFLKTFALSSVELKAVLFLGAVCTLIPFLLWWSATRLMKDISPFVTYCDPVTAAIIGFTIFKERLSPLQIIAVAFLVAAAFTHIMKRKIPFENLYEYDRAV